MTSDSVAIKLVLFDVDGVLTDGRLYFDSAGEVIKSFHAKDGIAMAILRAHGIKVGVLSGKNSPALHRRCSELGLDIVLTGVQDKLPAFIKLLQDLGLERGQAAYVGDDVNDITVLSHVGLSYAPADAHPLVLSLVTEICKAHGGQGVAREVAEKVLIKMGLSLQDIYTAHFGIDKSIRFVQ